MRKSFKQFRVPLACMDVQQQRARGIAGVGDVSRAAGEFPDQPTVHRAESQLALFGFLARPGNVVQNPAHFGSGKIGIQQQPGALLNHFQRAIAAQLIAHSRGAAILPHDRVVNRLARLAVPDDAGLALIGDAYRSDVARTRAHAAERFHGDSHLGRPDFFRIMLHPAGLRINLADLPLRDGGDLPAVIEKNRANAGGAGV